MSSSAVPQSPGLIPFLEYQPVDSGICTFDDLEAQVRTVQYVTGGSCFHSLSGQWLFQQPTAVGLSMS